ncbi:unnamed protein product, partial [Rotaria sp. Silwood2]
ASNGITVAGQSGVAGSLSNQFNLPTSITFDQYDNMYIMDSGNDRIQQWSPGFSYGVTVVRATALYNPRGLAIDPLGNLVVADCSNHRTVSFGVICRKFMLVTISIDNRLLPADIQDCIPKVALLSPILTEHERIIVNSIGIYF